MIRSLAEKLFRRAARPPVTRPVRRFRPALQHLEAREVMDAYVFTEAADTFWWNLNNWTQDGVAATSAPDADDSVRIPGGTECWYDVTGITIIESLEVEDNAILHMGMVPESGNHALHVAGTTAVSVLGGAGTGTPKTWGFPAEIIFDCFPEDTPRTWSADLVFQGTGAEVELRNVTFENSEYEDRMVRFENRMTRQSGPVNAWVDVKIGGAKYNTSDYRIDTGDTTLGVLNLSSEGRVEIKANGHAFCISGAVTANNNNPGRGTVWNDGTVVIFVSGGAPNYGAFEVQAKASGSGTGKVIRVKGWLVMSASSQMTHVVWDGAGMANAGGVEEVFEDGGEVHFVDSDHADSGAAGLAGDFTWEDGSRAEFYSYTLPKPDVEDYLDTGWETDDYEDIDTWFNQSFTSTPTNFGVWLDEDDAYNASVLIEEGALWRWNVVGDGVDLWRCMFSIYAGTFEAYGDAEVYTHGTAPDPSSYALVANVYGSVTFAWDNVYLFGDWDSEWNPDANHWGVTNPESPPPPPPPPPPPGGGEG